MPWVAVLLFICGVAVAVAVLLQLAGYDVRQEHDTTRHRLWEDT